ncbi:MAG: pyridoxamine 5'-phosphate oxidase family protein [Pseudomonadota bacterium]
MMKKISDILFSPAIRAMQAELGVRDYIARLESRDHWKAELSTEQMDFIRSRDSFYFGTASKEGCPYIQHRGGPAGFIRVESASALWFPDYSGNRQYISVGNLSENNQAFIFLMDYANRRRLKLWGRAHIQDHKTIPFDDTELSESATVERIIRFEIDALDENCSQHIQPRYPE